MTEWKITSRVRQVNENQCHMCMPLGGVLALRGVEDSIALVHGSQGCSTYMRLANVEHFNEPIDIASSSLNEKQAIFGGEANLRKALDNVIRVYRPKVIGILTSCLAETMGDDIGRFVETYKTDREIRGLDIIPISTPSYSGTHTEGFWATMRAVIAYYARPTERHQGVNVIVPNISPADIREIKRLLDLMGLEYTLLPDYSLTLDRPFGGRYKKIAPGGTPAAEIARMSGARATIQFGFTCPEKFSPGHFLEQRFGVPLINLPLPVGLDGTDLFVRTLREISEQAVPGSIRLERGWLCDAMADAHKINASARPVIYGEPELVYALAKLCLENGSVPAVIASGTQNSGLAGLLQPLLEGALEETVVLEEADFVTIEDAAVRTSANLAVGHSGGRYLTERQGIPGLRVGYPVHDRVGGQRILSVGYTGSLAFLDRFTNTLLEAKHSSYRRLRKEELLSERGVSNAKA
ncbi:nitrogenase [Methanoculleus taiwanensis]|uniref:Nitrogenase n=1 Tax=Methanoculleus taiwanensis TaxID=1550565 RepID=A0A498GZM5_9EURY|nr:nitrogenase component 1 [Methanoculleus taiwanensis]RXE55823.1 nitrogenase [Methanoculleus taiwanensis]